MGFIMRIFLFSIIALVIISCQSSSQDVSRVQSLLKKKAGIQLQKEEIELRLYNSEQVMGDFTEEYEILIPDSSHFRILSFVKRDTSWEEIEKGYQQLILPTKQDNLMYGFFVDKKEKIINIQVIKE